MKLKEAINVVQVESLRGVVDVYYQRGQPVARAWPRKAKQPNSPSQIEARQRLSRASKWGKVQGVEFQIAWQNSNNTPGRSYRDRYLSSAIHVQEYQELKQMPAITHTELKPANGTSYPRLNLYCRNSHSLRIEDFAVYVRAQPPTDPALSYFDAGWYESRCVALYKLYQPILTGFKGYTPIYQPATPNIWTVPLYATPDAVSWFITLKTRDGDFPETPYILWPATKTQLTL
jgi:hypothetical protein